MIRRRVRHPHLRSAVKNYPYLLGYTAFAATVSLALQIWQVAAR